MPNGVHTGRFITVLLVRAKVSMKSFIKGLNRKGNCVAGDGAEFSLSVL